MSSLVVIWIKYVSVTFFFWQPPDNTDTLPCPTIRVRIVQFQLILPWYDNTSWVRYSYPRLTRSSLYLSQEWHLMCSHYIILVAFKGACQSIKDELFRQQTGTWIIFVKGPGTQYSIFGQITTPPNRGGGKGGAHTPSIKVSGCSLKYSRTSIKRPPKTRRFRGRLWAVVSYGNRTRWGLSSEKKSPLI